jgi:hypothetical protein
MERNLTAAELQAELALIEFLGVDLYIATLKLLTFQA